MAMKKIICFLLGHKKSIPMLHENEDFIFTKGCPRCGTHLGWPATWKTMPDPPNSTPEQLKSWRDYLKSHWQEVRDSVTIH
jgi:hypothetical protein